jgi:hypothetical protein
MTRGTNRIALRAGGPRAGRGLPGIDTVHRLCWLVAALMAGAASAGLLAAGVYRDNPFVTAGWRGTDLVTLAVGVPLLALAIRGSSGGSRRWRMVMLGMLLYAFYNYAFYLFGAAFNALFLIYVAIMVASGTAMILGLAALDPLEAAAAFLESGPVRAVAGFLLVVGVLLGGFWIALSVIFLFTGEAPPMVAATDHPTNITGALDLSLVVAPGVVVALWLWKLRPWGYLLAVLWVVKGAVYMLALSIATVSAYRAGATEDVAQVALWVPIGLGCVIALAALLRPENDRDRSADREGGGR